jgi:hypothetical protein
MVVLIPVGIDEQGITQFENAVKPFEGANASVRTPQPLEESQKQREHRLGYTRDALSARIQTTLARNE